MSSSGVFSFARTLFGIAICVALANSPLRGQQYGLKALMTNKDLYGAMGEVQDRYNAAQDFAVLFARLAAEARSIANDRGLNTAQIVEKLNKLKAERARGQNRLYKKYEGAGDFDEAAGSGESDAKEDYDPLFQKIDARMGAFSGLDKSASNYFDPGDPADVAAMYDEMSEGFDELRKIFIKQQLPGVADTSPQWRVTRAVSRKHGSWWQDRFKRRLARVVRRSARFH